MELILDSRIVVKSALRCSPTSCSWTSDFDVEVTGRIEVSVASPVRKPPWREADFLDPIVPTAGSVPMPEFADSTKATRPMCARPQDRPLPDEAGRLEPAATASYDVLVMADTVAEITPEQQAAFLALLNQGIGVVSLSHNLVAPEKWPLWREIVGGQFLHTSEMIAGKPYAASVSEQDLWLKIGIPEAKHPITRGIEPFYILDEGYTKSYHGPDIQVVLTTESAGSDHEIGWTKWYGKSPVFHLQLGHDSHAWTHPLYKKVLLQSMRWASDEAAKRRIGSTP